MNWLSEIVLREGRIEYLLLRRVVKISVSTHSPLHEFDSNPTWSEWYTEHRNRGFLSPETLKALGNLPFVEARWGLLAKQLNAFREQSFDKQRK